MKEIIFVATLAIAIACACKSENEKYSKSYDRIKSFMDEAKIKDAGFIYFYAAKPKTTFPNVYCFDSNGVQLVSPPQCFQLIEDYIRLINDSIIPPKQGGYQLPDFLDSMNVVDAYDDKVDKSDLKGFQYYLFVDFVALPLPGLQQTLFRAKEAITSSRKMIKLFLVHAISEHNMKYFKKSKEAADSIPME